MGASNCLNHNHLITTEFGQNLHDQLVGHLISVDGVFNFEGLRLIVREGRAGPTGWIVHSKGTTRPSLKIFLSTSIQILYGEHITKSEFGLNSIQVPSFLAHLNKDGPTGPF